MNNQATPFQHRPQAIAAPQNWGRILRSAWVHARTAAIVLAATVLVGVLLSLLMPTKYRSEARLLALPSDYYAVSGRGGDSNSSAEAFKPEELTNVEIQLLSSEDLQRDTLVRSGMSESDAAALEEAR